MEKKTGQLYLLQPGVVVGCVVAVLHQIIWSLHLELGEHLALRDGFEVLCSLRVPLRVAALVYTKNLVHRLLFLLLVLRVELLRRVTFVELCITAKILHFCTRLLSCLLESRWLMTHIDLNQGFSHLHRFLSA